MTQLFNLNSSKSHRRILRKEMPKAEKILWWRLRNKSLNGFKFRRQYSIGKFIVDFYCPEARLVIEIDGDTHYTEIAQEKDKKRQLFIEKLSLKILRFTNEEVYSNLDGVLEVILKSILITSPRPSPSEGEGFPSTFSRRRLG